MIKAMDNIRNIEFTLTDLNNILSPYVGTGELKNVNMDIFREAFTQKSCLNVIKNENSIFDETCVSVKPKTNSYERLEFIGDRVIRMPIIDIATKYYGKNVLHSSMGLYNAETYSHSTEEFLTRLTSKLEQKTTLALLCKKLGLNKFIILPAIEERNNIRENERVMEDVFESFMGALYLTFGFNLCKDFITAVIDVHIDVQSLIKNPDNYKDTFVKEYHRITKNTPKFEIKKINKTKVDCYIYIRAEFFNPTLFTYINADNIEVLGYLIGIGSGKNRKEAETACSKNALGHMGKTDFLL
jgi:dsRNA-specific ribonuclease